MTRKTKQYYLGVAAIIIMCMILGVVVRNSITGTKNYSDIEGVTEFDDYILDGRNREQYFEGDINTYEELENKSDLVVRIKIDHERIRYNDTTKTTVLIQNVYKGSDEYSVGDAIKVYEPAVVGDERIYTFANGYQLMNSQEEYILFLKHLDTIEGYQYQRDEKDCFLPVSTLYAKHSTTKDQSELESMQAINYEEKECTYKDIKTYPIIPASDKEIEIYKRINKKVLEKYVA